MRDTESSREASLERADGVVLANSIKLLDQHHPGASRHPSSAEEGNYFFSFANSWSTAPQSLDNRTIARSSAPVVRGTELLRG